jgi:uroporphyrinogen III methyltransferase / synthase
MTSAPPGKVYLVGAGPGDPGLITVRGAEVLAAAQVVVHDRLTDAGLLALAPAAVELVDVGKQPDDRGDQEAINKLLVDKAREGLTVVRLKGGDPFVFGRGGEEAMALLAAGVPFEVVPGVSAAIAAPAYAGVPVTHRGLVSSFTVVAGHSRSVDTPPALGGTNWEALAAAGGTIVVLMGAARRAKVAERLMRGGLSPATPVLCVQWGTEPYQTTARTTLGDLGRTELQPPVTIVIGEVAGLDLSWAPRQLLRGRLVVVTRAPHQSSALTRRLHGLGARVLQVPTISLAPPEDGGGALAAAAGRLSRGHYAWTVFSSANTVERFFAFLPDSRAFGATRVAAIGPATTEALRGFRVVPDLVPADQRAEGLVAEFPAAPTVPSAPGAPGVPGVRAVPGAPGAPGASPAPGGGAPPASRLPAAVLLPQAAAARPELRNGLEKLGWEVDAVVAYRTVPAEAGAELLRRASQADAVCFASPSALDSYLDQAARAGAGIPDVVVCIGPTTSEAARRRGLRVTAEAGEQSIDGLARALVNALSEPGTAGEGGQAGR